MNQLSRLLSIVSLFVLGLVAPALAAGNPDRTQFGHDIRLEAGQQAADLTCVNCSVYIAGDVAGDVTAINGRVVLEGAGQVAGDVTAVLGDVRVDSGTKISGDLTAVGGKVRRATDAQVAGDVTELQGKGWLLLMIAVPLFILGSLIALVVWLLQRNRRPAQVPARA
jgi:hypothetical protein